MEKPRVVRSRSSVVLGSVMVLLGLLFMFQGLGKVKGSPMTGSNFWAGAGPVIALVGVTLIVRGARRTGPPDHSGQ
jgi:predicted transporter